MVRVFVPSLVAKLRKPIVRPVISVIRTAVTPLPLQLIIIFVTSVAGFEMQEQFKAINFEIIFIRAHEKFVLKAFKASAADYLYQSP